MNFRKITFLAALVTVFNFYSCKDDEEVVTIEERDETEVYNEDILEIEERIENIVKLILNMEDGKIYSAHSELI